MPINFPDSPSLNDTHTVGDKTWIYNGSSWDVVIANQAPNQIRDADNDTKIEAENTADDDTLRFSTAGTERMTITSAGHLIPSANETYDLGSASNRFRDIYLSGTTIDLGGVEISSDGTNLALPPISNISGDFTVDTSTLHVDSTNNRVGIGTTSPAFKLDAKGQVQIGADDNITPDADGNGHLMIDGAGYTGFASLDGTAMWVGHNSALRDLHLATDETARMTIDRSGRVTAPYQPFVQAKSPGGGNVTPPAQVWQELNSSYWGGNWITSQNIGSHFNTSTARLTAPVSGVYFMTWTAYYQSISGGSASYIHPTIMINNTAFWNNGQQPYNIYGFSYDGLQNGVTMTFTFYLSAGDYVAPACYFYSTNDVFHGSYSYLSAGLLH